MLDLLGEDWALVLVGFAGGVLLGLAARLGRFCTLGAIEDYHFAGQSLRLRMWGVALGFGIMLIFAAQMLGWFDATRSVYLLQTPGLVAAALGGLIFGLGMALAGNCGFGALSRLGGGEMRSFVIVVVMGLTAMATLSGPLAELRLAIFPRVTSAEGTGVAQLIGGATGIAPALVGALLGVSLFAVSYFGASDRRVLWGLPVACAIALGFVGSAWIAREGFAPVSVTSHSFAAPIGETMIYAMLSSGISPGFGVGSVLGVLVGAFMGSTSRGVFKWEACDDHRELRRQIGGAMMMGFGAVLSFGCSVGQGLSAFSVLAVTAPVTLGAIWLGGYLGLRYMIEGPAFVKRWQGSAAD